MTADADNIDDLELPGEDDVASSGAAAESAEWNEKLQRLPRILRYAVLGKRRASYLRERLVAEIAELAPGLTQTVHWVYGDDPGQGLALAAELDQLAVTRDRPDLRSLADCVRLLSLPLPGAPAHDHDHRRVAKALAQAASQLPPTIDLELAAEVETISLGWAILPTSMDALTRLREDHAITAAYHAGRHMMQWRVALTEARLRKEFAEEKQAQEKATAKAAEQAGSSAEAVKVPQDHVLVCQLSDADMKNPKMREIILPLKPAINVALPLVLVPPLHEIRNRLLFEFPYAEHVIDFALADLVGRRTIRLRPLLLVGEPGGGKSRFVRRLAEILNIGCWRTDASRSDGAVFGGTDKRWYSAEACHPVLGDRAGQTRQSDRVNRRIGKSRHPHRLWPPLGLPSGIFGAGDCCPLSGPGVAGDARSQPRELRRHGQFARSPALAAARSVSRCDFPKAWAATSGRAAPAGDRRSCRRAWAGQPLDRAA